MNYLYWNAGGQWVVEAAAAWEFRTLHEAALKALEDKARTTSVVVIYQDPVCELVLNPHFCVARNIRRHGPP